MSALPAIELVGVHKAFGQVRAVRGIDLSVAPGEFLGFLGPNGAGKTTTLEMIEGLQEPTSGTIRVLGKTWDEGRSFIRQKIGVAFQETRFEGLVTIRETVELFRSFFSNPLGTVEVLKLVRLESVGGLRVSSLSGGQRQRLALAVGLVGNPEIVFLDEPTTGLDPQSRQALWAILGRLREEGRTIVLTTHYMDEVEQLCSRIVVVDHGQIIASGTAAQLRARLGGRQMIELVTQPQLSAAELGALPGVLSVSTHQSRWRLVVEDASRTLTAIAAWANAPDHALVHLSVRESSLDDVFISLTEKSVLPEALP